MVVEKLCKASVKYRPQIPQISAMRLVDYTVINDLIGSLKNVGKIYQCKGGRLRPLLIIQSAQKIATKLGTKKI